MTTADTKTLPAAHFNAELRKLGRGFDDAEVISMSWRGDEFGMDLRWPDGFTRWVGLGLEASAVIEARFYATTH